MKKINIILLLLASVVITAQAHDFAVKNSTGTTIWYNDVTEKYGANAVEVTFQGTWYGDFDDEYKSTVVIPSEITVGATTYKVVGIGEQAFSQCFSLRTITIPESIEYIGNKAFEACCHLRTINYNAVNCNDLTLPSFAPFSYNNMAYGKYEYPADDPSYPDSYWSAYDLREVNIGENVEHIPSYMFYGMGGELAQADYTGRTVKVEYSKVGVTKVNFNGTPVSIGNQAFRACTVLRSISIPAGVQSVGQAVFADCDTLQSVTLPDEMPEIPAYFFSCCKELETVNFPATIKRINFEAFKNCAKIQNLQLPEGLITVGPSAFRACQNLTTVILPSTLEFIDGYAFSDCNVLTEIVIPDNVSEIGNYAFEDCTHLSSVKLGENTRLIGNFVFAGCINLSEGEMFVPKHAPNISANTFLGVENSMKVVVAGGDESEYINDGNWGRFFTQSSDNVESVSQTETSVRKIIHKNQVVIGKGDRYYDILGRETILY